MQTPVTRRRFAAGALAVLSSVAVIRPTGAADRFAFKFGTDTPVDHPSNVRGRECFEAIRKETNGQVDIALFPNNQLGGATAMLTQVRSGALTFQLIDGVTLASVAPLCGIQGVGFAFKDSWQALAAMDGDLGALVHKNIESKELFAFERMFLNGMRQVTSSTKPIAAPDDLRGFKLRTPPAKMSIDLFKSLGAAPTPINFNEVYTALQTKVVDGQENPMAVIELARLFEVQKYLSETSHMWSGYWMIGHAPSVAALPSDLKTIVLRNFARYADLQRKDTDDLNTTLQQKLEKHGMTINRIDPTQFRSKLGSFYARWKAEFGDQAWAALEKHAGKLA